MIRWSSVWGWFLLWTVAVHAQETLIKLPFPTGFSCYVIQGNHGKLSHHDPLNEFAWDFALPVGAPVCAAAAGRVISIRQDSDQGGWSDQYLGSANAIVIDHGSGLSSQYVHLKFNSARVVVGEIVQAGQVIAEAGATGKTNYPHLHFGLVNKENISCPGRFVDFPKNDGVPMLRDLATSGPVTDAVSSFHGDSVFPADAFAKNGLQLLSPLPCYFFEEGRRFLLQVKVTTEFQRVRLCVQLEGRPADQQWSAQATVDDAGMARPVLRMEKPWSLTSAPTEGYRLQLFGVTADNQQKTLADYPIVIAPSTQSAK